MAHILIVEDDITNAQLAVLICHEAGHTTRHVRDGMEALKSLLRNKSEAFDLVLLDVLMPHMDGIDLAMMLRDAPAYAGLPLIAITGVTGTRDTAKLISAGVDKVITKPYRPEQLRDAIAEALASKSS